MDAEHAVRSDVDNDLPAETELAEEVLVVEISIDGMCGVY
jgi:mycofactocin precursor